VPPEKIPWLILLGVGAAFSVLLLWLPSLGDFAADRNRAEENSQPVAGSTHNSAGTIPATTTSQTARSTLDESFSGLANSAATAANTAENQALRLQKATRLLLGLSPDESAAAIIHELESGRDASTGLEFEVGDEGLQRAPTWRVYLLDLLGTIDPKSAAEYARRQIFAAPSSPDEWAVSLRNILLSWPSRYETAAREEIGLRLREMLQRDEWRASPSRGMMESLDFLAHTPRPAELVPLLQKWLVENTATRPELAVQIALERTVTTRPRELLTALGENASLLGGSRDQRALRASLMARADLGDAVQASAVQKYLHSLDPSSEEAIVFFRCFPERRFAVSPGLASQPLIPTADTFTAANESALAVFSAWLNDPVMAKHSSSITALAEKVNDLR